MDEKKRNEGILAHMGRTGPVELLHQYQPEGRMVLADAPKPLPLLGAVCGDVAGSAYEHHNIKRLPTREELMPADACITDDTVMTVAVAEGLRRGLAMLPLDWQNTPGAEGELRESVRRRLRDYGRRYPNAGYGGSFRRWLHSAHAEPYYSWGNGSAMRASFAGWMARSLEEAEALGRVTAMPTHDHPEGILGAEKVAGCIRLLRDGAGKEDIRAYAARDYSMDFTLDGIRDSYRFDVSCRGSVPQAIMAFLEGGDFEEVLARAISIGGDSDTIAAIAGSIAEVVYPIPIRLREQVTAHLPPRLENELIRATQFARQRTGG